MVYGRSLKPKKPWKLNILKRISIQKNNNMILAYLEPFFFV